MIDEPYGPGPSDRQLAPSHFCDDVGSTVHCDKRDCPYCDFDGGDA